jgi:hypothetical protein
MSLPPVRKLTDPLAEEGIRLGEAFRPVHEADPAVAPQIAACACVSCRTPSGNENPKPHPLLREGVGEEERRTGGRDEAEDVKWMAESAS